MKKISEKLLSINPGLKIFIDQEWWNINRFKDFDNLSERNIFLKNAVNNSWVSNNNKIEILEILEWVIWNSYYPSLLTLSKKYDEIPEKLQGDYLKTVTYLRLKTLKERGINTYWLVVDLNYWNPIISGEERSFSKHTDKYEKFWKAMIDSAKKIGWMTIYLKHFPWHWAWEIDTHVGALIYWNKEVGYLKENISLFESLVDYWKGIVWLMVWHIILSKELKEDFDRIIKKWEYILTDDLWMKWLELWREEIKKHNNKFFTTDSIKWKVIKVSTKEPNGVI